MARVKESDNNLRLWNALGKTDPAHTKQFTRAGGFKGTAVKPMWANKQMTEFFGPCGIGWGPEKPEFTVVQAEGETLVYCTVGLWYMDGTQRGQVYGEGGDKVCAKSKDGFRTDDEAFKKAYTDALSNAMKFIGVAADVHMGQFDDNKYVREVAAEFDAEKKAEAAVYAEVERQKAAYTGGGFNNALAPPSEYLQEVKPSLVPPELDWSYNEKTGLLICRIVSISKRKKKDGKGDYLMITVNGRIGDKEPATLFYLHESFREELTAAVGKVIKCMVTAEDKFPKIDEVLEIDGKQMLRDDYETQARLLASTLEFSEKDLTDLYTKFCGKSWAIVLEKLQAEKVRREEEVAQ